MAHEDLLKIDCTTTVVLRNTRKKKYIKTKLKKKQI